MEKIINEVTEKLNKEIKEFFSERAADVGSAERYFGSRIAEAVLELLRAYYEKCDRELLADKAGRKQGTGSRGSKHTSASAAASAWHLWKRALRCRMGKQVHM